MGDLDIAHLGLRPTLKTERPPRVNRGGLFT